MRRAVRGAGTASALALAAGIWPSSDRPGRPAEAAAVTGRPNVVVILVDDLDVRSFARLVAAGLLPDIKDLANRGVTFTNAFVTNAVCAASRATFLTGQYSHNHGVLTNAPPNGGVGAFDDRSTLATWLQDAGYRTGHVGKYLNYYGIQDLDGDGSVDLRDALYVPPGWDDWQALIDPSTYLMYQHVINDNGTVVRYGTAEGDYQTDVLAARAVRFIDAAAQDGDRPFFLVVAPSAPHNELWPTVPHETFAEAWRWTIRPAPRHAGTVGLPVPPVPSFNEPDLSDKPSFHRDHPLLGPEDMWYVQRKYRDRLAATRAIDDLVGAVTRALDRNGQRERTAVVFTSDNGFLQGEHRLPEKLYPYEEALRVPLVVSLPGPAAPRSSPSLVLNADLAPTIAELAGIAPGGDPDGRSLVPLLRDPERLDWRRRFLVEHFPVEGSEPLVFEVPAYAGVRTTSLAYVEYDDGTGSREFYDLALDPFQLASLHADPAPDRVEQRRTLSQWLAALRSCASGSCQAIEFLVYP